MISSRCYLNRFRELRFFHPRQFAYALLSSLFISSSVVGAEGESVVVDFDSEPALLTQIQGMANETGDVPTTASSPWLTVAVRGARRDGFELALDRSESGDGIVSQSEQVGYLALETNTGSSFTDVDGNNVIFAAQRTGETIVGWNNGCTPTSFTASYIQPPLVFASKISRKGDNGGWLRRCSLSPTAVGLVVDEDIAVDSERSHLAESAAIVSFNRPFSATFDDAGDTWQLSAARVTLVDTLTDTPRFTDVQFASAFEQVPIVFALTTSQGGDPSALRMRNVTRTGFSIAQVEPAGNDGPHVAMDIHYLAVTPGSHLLPDGTQIVADIVDVSTIQAASGIGDGNSGWTDTLWGDDDPDNNQAPDARFVTDLANGEAPLTVQFDAMASSDDNGIVEYAWQFGDGSSATRPDAVQVSHQYVDAGSFNASLTVTDSEGLSDTLSTVITVREPDATDQPPEARFTQSTNSGAAPLSVAFDAATSSDDVAIASLRWDFGDGTSATDSAVSHVFRNTGLFTVTLTVTDSAGQSDSATSQIDVRSSGPNTISDVDAARFLTQATFGPTLASIAELKSLGYEAWIDRQLNLIGEPHLDWVQEYSNGSNTYARHEPWWMDAVDGADQLRQRVAFALSQIFVVSDIGYVLSNNQYGISNYYDMLRKNAFANYRTLLEDVTLNPIMGTFLSMVKNERENVERNIRPDENYAREVMQLFSIGIHELDIDGTVRVDSNGQGVPTYDQTTVQEFARVFTGWHFAGVDYWERTYYGQDMFKPMEPWEEYHDNGAKTLLGGEAVPAGLSAAEDLDRALDNIFRHENVAPFISKQLIQKLVTSNPTPGYIRRVATTFNNNGNGEKGDLGAVIKAILLDPEARDGFLSIASFGKIREPVVRLAHLFRSFNLTPGAQSRRGEFNTASPALALINADTGQAVLKSPSVFNFYHPGFSPVGPVKDANLVSPEFEIATENNVIATASRISKQIQYYHHGSDSNALNASTLDLSREFELAADVNALLDHLNLLLLSGSMSPQLRDVLSLHLEAIGGDAEGRSQRARDAITLIMASPDYIVQR